MTRTHTLTCPRMVRRALGETSGITSSIAGGDVPASLRASFAVETAETGAVTCAGADGVVAGVCNRDPTGAWTGGGVGVRWLLIRLTTVQTSARITTTPTITVSRPRGFRCDVTDGAGRAASGASCAVAVRGGAGSALRGSGATNATGSTVAAGAGPNGWPPAQAASSGTLGRSCGLWLRQRVTTSRNTGEKSAGNAAALLDSLKPEGARRLSASNRVTPSARTSPAVE